MDHLGLPLVLYLLIAIGAWTALAFFIAPFIGRWLRGDFSADHPDRERVGLMNEPSLLEHYRNERTLAAARGEVHAARARRRRLDAMERERAGYEDGQERAS